MSIDAILALLGIVLAVYAIPGPAQRQSLRLLVPIRLVLAALLFSMILICIVKGGQTFGYPLPPRFAFILQLLSLLAPVAALAYAVKLWARARLTPKMEEEFRKFLLTCLRESSYGELSRILEQNTKDLAKVLPKDTLWLLFDRRFVRALISTRSLLHLQLLQRPELRKLLPHAPWAARIVLRELVLAEDTPLHATVADLGGGDIVTPVAADDEGLINATVGNPSWYMECEGGTALLRLVEERLASGEYDRRYNLCDANYVSNHGPSSRSRCPIWLAAKTMFNVLAEAGERDFRDDLHATDLAFVFYAVYDHSKYSRDVWENPQLDPECRTPFAYLMYTITSDLSWTLRDAYKRAGNDVRPPGVMARAVAEAWKMCLLYMASGEEGETAHVSKDFRHAAVHTYLELLLEYRKQAQAESGALRESRDAWCKVLLEEMKKGIGLIPQSWGLFKEVLRQMTNDLKFNQGDVLSLSDELAPPGAQS